MLEKSPRGDSFCAVVGGEDRNTVRYITDFSEAGFGNYTVALLTEFITCMLYPELCDLLCKFSSECLLDYSHGNYN